MLQNCSMLAQSELCSPTYVSVVPHQSPLSMASLLCLHKPEFLV